jgi:hypothetical protein
MKKWEDLIPGDIIYYIKVIRQNEFTFEELLEKLLIKETSLIESYNDTENRRYVMDFENDFENLKIKIPYQNFFTENFISNVNDDIILFLSTDKEKVSELRNSIITNKK